LTVNSKIIKKDCRKIRFVEEEKMTKMTIMSLADWAKADVDEIRERWAKRRRELEEIEKKKAEREKKIDEAKKRKEEKRKSNKREKMFCVQDIWAYGPLLQKQRRERGTSTGALK